MSMHPGLLDAIRAETDSDEPRLILADWLEDHDEPERAEFIRLQCVLARLPAHHDLRPELEARERGLLLLHEAEWTGLPTNRNVGGSLRRGFLDTLAIPARLLLRAPDVFLGSGTVRRLTLEIADFADLRGLAALPQLRSVRVLHLTGTRLHRAGVAALAESPHLRQLTGLHLRFDNVARGALLFCRNH